MTKFPIGISHTKEIKYMTAHGDNFESAKEAFYFTFDATYKNYAEESDEKLTKKAQKLKKKLLKLVKEIL